MKESYRKGLADHPAPESCVDSRKVATRLLLPPGMQPDQMSAEEIRLFVAEGERRLTIEAS